MWGERRNIGQIDHFTERTEAATAGKGEETLREAEQTFIGKVASEPDLDWQADGTAGIPPEVRSGVCSWRAPSSVCDREGRDVGGA